MEASLQKQQEASNNNDMHPIWQHQSNIRMNKRNNQSVTKKADQKCRDARDANKMGRLGKRTLQKSKRDMGPKIMHISDQEWEGDFLRTQADLQEIRQHAELTKL